jgi:YVTN family beta-propeller protein
MHKYVPYLFIILFFACIAACSSSGSSASTPVALYDLPTSFASYSSSKPHLMGGAVQGSPLGLSNKVSTLAGTAGSAGFFNYSGSAVGAEARFDHLNDITTDGTNFYVADYMNNAIRKITPAGVVTTLKCTSTDGITPISFSRPTGITTDGVNLYVADSASNSVRFIEIATNKVTTIIGSTIGLAGSVDSATDIAAVRFYEPIGITTDGINLYVTDYNNATVRRIVIATGAVYTVAGSSGVSGSTDGFKENARFNKPGRITTNGKDLYLTDFNNRSIRKIIIATGEVTTITGSPGPMGTADGTLAEARFSQPNGITTDGTNLYVTDSYQNTIRKIDIASGVVSTISGISGTAGLGGSIDSSSGTPSYYTPIGVTTDGINLYVADSFNSTVRRIQ